MVHQPLQMKVSKTQQLHHKIVDDYESWIAEAPLSYTKNGFFIDSVPITITSCCGQNKEIFCPTELEGYQVELASWSRLRDCSQIKHISLAIASHTS